MGSKFRILPITEDVSSSGADVGEHEERPPRKRGRGRPATRDFVVDSSGHRFPVSQRYAGWQYTAQLPDQREYIERLEQHDGVELHVCGREFAPSTGKCHGQGVFRVAGGISFEELREMVPGLHVERARSIPKLVKYCRKDGDMIYDRGAGTTVSARVVKEDATMDCLNIISSSSSYREAMNEIERVHPVFLFWHRQKIEQACLRRFPPPGGLSVDLWAPYGGYGQQ